MQYLPVFFAVFQIFFLAALVVYYIFQTVLRIAQQMYITRVFYGHDEALGRQAQRAGQAARDEAAKSGEATGLFGQPKRDPAGSKDTGTSKNAKGSSKSANNEPAKGAAGKKTPAKSSGKQAIEPAEERPMVTSKRVTPPKNRPTPSTGAKGRPTPSRARPQSKSSRPKSSDA